MTPNENTLKVLEDVLALANSRDTVDGETADSLRMLCRDYCDLLEGRWQATPERAAEVLQGRVEHAKHCARENGLLDISAALIALRPSVCGESVEAARN